MAFLGRILSAVMLFLRNKIECRQSCAVNLTLEHLVDIVLNRFTLNTINYDDKYVQGPDIY